MEIKTLLFLFMIHLVKSEKRGGKKAQGERREGDQKGEPEKDGKGRKEKGCCRKESGERVQGERRRGYSTQRLYRAQGLWHRVPTATLSQRQQTLCWDPPGPGELRLQESP